MRKVIALVLFLSIVSTANAQIASGGCQTIGLSGMTLNVLDNNAYLACTDFAGTGTNSLLKCGVDDDTYLNCDAGELIKFSEAGTSALSFDPSTGTFSYTADIIFSEGANPNFTIDADGDADDVNLLLGQNATTAPVFTIRGQTSDGDDDGQLTITAGGAVSNIRGAFIKLHGNEHGGGAGNLSLAAGNNAGNGSITFEAGGVIRTSILYTADADDATIALGKAATTAPVFTICGQTADADDDGALKITGAGGIGNTRGGYIEVFGNEEGTYGGHVNIYTGDVAGADMILSAKQGGIYFATLGSQRYYFSSADFTQDPTNGGNIIMTKVDTGVLVGAGASALPAAFTGSFGSQNFVAVNNSVSDYHLGLYQFGANAVGARLNFAKTRGADATTQTIPNSGDALGAIYAYGADGTNFDAAAAIEMSVDGTPGAGTDMPGRIVFLTSPDGSATPAEAVRIANDKKVTVAGEFIGSSTGSLGWHIVSGANTACDTTCTSAAVMGWDGTTPVNHDDAAADICLCAGAS